MLHILNLLIMHPVSFFTGEEVKIISKDNLWNLNIRNWTHAKVNSLRLHAVWGMAWFWCRWRSCQAAILLWVGARSLWSRDDRMRLLLARGSVMKGNFPNWSILLGEGKEINEMSLVKAIEKDIEQTESSLVIKKRCGVTWVLPNCQLEILWKVMPKKVIAL